MPSGGYFDLQSPHKEPLTIAFIGAKGCGKTAFIQRVLKYHPRYEWSSFVHNGSRSKLSRRQHGLYSVAATGIISPKRAISGTIIGDLGRPHARSQ